PTAAAAAQSMVNLPAIERPFLAYSGTVQRSLYSRCSLPSVSRPADSPKLNLRGRYGATVPANGCLAKLALWPRQQIVGDSRSQPRFGNSQAQGDLRLPLTSTYHGCPRFLCGAAQSDLALKTGRWKQQWDFATWKLCPRFCLKRGAVHRASASSR